MARHYSGLVEAFSCYFLQQVFLLQLEAIYSAVTAACLQTFKDVQAGKLPDFPTIEWYCHTTVDRSLQDENGYHNSALFVQWQVLHAQPQCCYTYIKVPCLYEGLSESARSKWWRNVMNGRIVL